MERDGLTFIVRIIKCCYLSQSEKRNDRDQIRVDCLRDTHRHIHTYRHLHVPCATSKVFFHNFSLKTHDILPFIFLSVHFRRMTSTLFLNEKVINVYALFSCRLKPFFYRAYISFREFVTGRQICSIFLSLAIGDIYRIFLRDKKKVQIIRRHFCTFTLVCLITKFGENANTFKFLFFMKENP